MFIDNSVDPTMWQTFAKPIVPEACVATAVAVTQVSWHGGATAGHCVSPACPIGTLVWIPSPNLIRNRSMQAYRRRSSIGVIAPGHPCRLQSRVRHSPSHSLAAGGPLRNLACGKWL